VDRAPRPPRVPSPRLWHHSSHGFLNELREV